MIKRVALILLLPVAAIALEKTGIDYDMSKGSKPIKPLHDYKSKLRFEATPEGVKSHFSDLEVEEQKNKDKVMILRLTQNKIVKHEFVDFDLSGRFESWKVYELGFVASEARLDEAKGLTLEKTVYDQNGNILQVLRDDTRRV